MKNKRYVSFRQAIIVPILIFSYYQVKLCELRLWVSFMSRNYFLNTSIALSSAFLDSLGHVVTTSGLS